MKNGSKRSPTWIKRNLPSYVRENATRGAENVQSLLQLVIHDLVPSLADIGTWTPAQRLLADDWAANVHLRASDNNNRIPAVPEHLKPYLRSYPQRKPPRVAREVVKAMSDDNGNCYHPTEQQWARLEDGIRRMQLADCFFTDAEIDLFAAGEHGEMLAHFQRFDGFEIAQDAMVKIFDELDDAGQVKGDEQRAADRRRAHA